MDVQKELTKYIVNRFMHGDDSKLHFEESFFESGIIDSLGVLQLVSFLEERFGVHIEDEELVPENFETISKLIEFIERKMVAISNNERVKK